ncbi:MAG TPA: hypothetical protein VIV40_35605 [Kofleriaceae bacterium]
MSEYAKIAVSLPSHLVAKARRAVKQGLAPSVSAYIADAVDQKAMRDELDAMLDEWLAESGGPPTPEERRRARRKLAVLAKRGRLKASR